MHIQTVVDQRRGCGWRKEGGLYLRAEAPGASCGKLPLKLDACPVCHGGIKLTRSLQAIIPSHLFAGTTCRGGDCASCALGDANLPQVTRGWLMGVGVKHYTVSSFLSEAMQQGISKRIAQLPRDFRVGADIVFLGMHGLCVSYTQEQAAPELSEDDDEERLVEVDDPGTKLEVVARKLPGVFCYFIPNRIEYVVREDDSAEALERLEARGFTLVRVIRAEERQLELVDGLDHTGDY